MRHVNWFLTLFLTLQSEFSSCGGKKSSWLPHQQLGCWLPLLVYRSHCQSEASQSLLTYRVSLLVVFVVLLNCHESITCVSISVLAACVWQGGALLTCNWSVWETEMIADKKCEGLSLPGLSAEASNNAVFQSKREVGISWHLTSKRSRCTKTKLPKSWLTDTKWYLLTNAHAIKAVQTPCISRRGNEVADVIMHFVLQLLYMDPPRAYE